MFAEHSACLPAWPPACLPTCSLAGPPAYWHSNLHTCLLSCLSARLLTCTSSYLLAFKPAYLTVKLHACLPEKLPAYFLFARRSAYLYFFNLLSSCQTAYLPAHLLTCKAVLLISVQTCYLPVKLTACLPTCSVAHRPAYYVALKPACLPVLDNSCLRHPSVCPSCLSFNSISWSISACSPAYTCMYETIYLSV
jgi:hypothetical protein